MPVLNTQINSIVSLCTALLFLTANTVNAGAACCFSFSKAGGSCRRRDKKHEWSCSRMRL